LRSVVKLNGNEVGTKLTSRVDMNDGAGFARVHIFGAVTNMKFLWVWSCHVPTTAEARTKTRGDDNKRGGELNDKFHGVPLHMTIATTAAASANAAVI
jgi:hypothetical protein